MHGRVRLFGLLLGVLPCLVVPMFRILGRFRLVRCRRLRVLAIEIWSMLHFGFARFLVCLLLRGCNVCIRVMLRECGGARLVLRGGGWLRLRRLVGVLPMDNWFGVFGLLWANG
jgi:hypothetical protein